MTREPIGHEFGKTHWKAAVKNESEESFVGCLGSGMLVSLVAWPFTFYGALAVCGPPGEPDSVSSWMAAVGVYFPIAVILGKLLLHFGQKKGRLSMVFLGMLVGYGWFPLWVVLLVMAEGRS